MSLPLQKTMKHSHQGMKVIKLFHSWMNTLPQKALQDKLLASLFDEDQVNEVNNEIALKQQEEEKFMDIVIQNANTGKILITHRFKKTDLVIHVLEKKQSRTQFTKRLAKQQQQKQQYHRKRKRVQDNQSSCDVQNTLLATRQSTSTVCKNNGFFLLYPNDLFL